ncbi:MAG: hypothetical protein DIU79_11215 [Actinobacteria bacterium]|nr:MAG: hypothetical protein DIU79_11215 [Actinomycetota bacterium]
MLFAYVDESGDPTGDPAFRGSPSYTLGVVLVPAAQWPDAFDSLINLRRELKRNLSTPARAEIKASYLVRNEGVFTKLGLSSKQRLLSSPDELEQSRYEGLCNLCRQT